MNNILLNLILICHFFVVCFVVLVPFIGNNYMLLLHSILVPFMMLHWILNDNTCVLSTIETKIRERMNDGKPLDRNECFTCKLIDPIYDFSSNYESYSNMIYVITIILWIISISKLYCGFSTGSIKSISDVLVFK
jgi:hypothetical protein